MGINPQLWGAIFHDCMLFVALTYPEKPSQEQCTHMTSFLFGMFHSLPCELCKPHAVSYIQDTPPDVSSRTNLLEWIITFHNNVNDRLGKKSDWKVSDAIQSLSDRTLHLVQPKEEMVSKTYKNELIITIVVAILLIVACCTGMLIMWRKCKSRR
jgi:hypothetical protein